MVPGTVAGEIVSAASLERDDRLSGEAEYGMGIADMSEEDGRGAVGQGGSHVGFKSLALCLPTPGIVVVALTKSERVQSTTLPARSPAPPAPDAASARPIGTSTAVGTLPHMKMLRRALVALSFAGTIAGVLRLRGKGGVPPQEGGWREVSVPPK